MKDTSDTERSGSDESLGGLVFDALQRGVLPAAGIPFAQYVEAHPTNNWLIFSDYVLHHPGRPNDVFSFTVVPAGQYLAPLTREVSAIAKRDFKDTKIVHESMIGLLRDPHLFSFCFIVEPTRVLTRNVDAIRGMIDRSLARLNSKPDRHLRHKDIAKLTALRRKAAAGGFNIRLFDNITLAAAMAAYLTYLICSNRRGFRIGWFSDRDSITSSYEAIAYHFYASNVAIFCERHLDGWPGPALGVNAPVKAGRLWCDAFLRIPDHLAGVVSAWDVEQNTLAESAPKYLHVLADVIAGNPKIQIARLILNSERDLVSADTQSIATSRKHGIVK
jgi:hypothetical protein